jgi:hypothetical protein
MIYLVVSLLAVLFLFSPFIVFYTNIIHLLLISIVFVFAISLYFKTKLNFFIFKLLFFIFKFF